MISKFSPLKLKSVSKESKLSYVIEKMIVERIHRILIEDNEFEMIISVVNFKDILIYLLRMANESEVKYYTLPIDSFLENAKLKNITITSDKPFWEAMETLTDRVRSKWICVVDPVTEEFEGMIFREDFQFLLEDWNMKYVKM